MPPRHDQPKMPEPAAAPHAAPSATAAPHAAPPAAPDAAPERKDDKPSLVERLSAVVHDATQPADSMDCPHCGGRLESHGPTDGPKRGAQHCDSCGCCLLNGEPRPGTMRCTVPVAP